MLRGVALLPFIGLMGASRGCETRLCDAEADPTAHYRLEVLDEYDEQGRFAFTTGLGDGSPVSTGRCLGADGIQPGAVVELQATGTDARQGDVCLYVTTNLTSAPQPLVRLGPSTDLTATLEAQGNGSMYALENVSFGGCAGVVVLEVFGATDAPAVEGQLPKVLLYRLFLPASGSSCLACDDNFVVQLAKL
jgi:hypothetical protein